MSDELTPLDSGAIEAAILNIRGVRVMLDRDLAAFYRVKPIALRQAVKRNPERFPADIMFQLTTDEAELLVSQSVIPSRRSLGGALPHVFTEHGALPLSSVLRSQRATQVGLFIVRAFVRLGQILINDLETAKRLVELEVKVWKHDRVIKQLVDAAREFIKEQSRLKTKLVERSEPRKRHRIGFGERE